MKRLAGALIFLMLFPAGAQAGKSALAEQKAEVLRMVEDMTCTQDADCAAIPMGARACGGPQFYVVFVPSELKDSAKFESTVAAYTDGVKAYNLSAGMAGICSVVTKPELTCVESRCHIQPESWDSFGVRSPAVACRLAGEQRCLEE